MARIKGKISQDILRRLLTGGAVVVNGPAAHFWSGVFSRLWPERSPEFNSRGARDAFYYLKSTGLIVGEKKSDQFYIYLTTEGEKQAENYRLSDLEIRRPKAWDGKWRVVVFDILKAQRSKREAFRNRLKGLGFYPLQKSAWVIPFPCQKEIRLLKEFFKLGSRDLWLIEADKVEDDQFLKEFFHLAPSESQP